MTCKTFEELLSAYVEGELSAAERSEMDGHIASCPACAELLAFFREAEGALAGFPEVEPGPELMARLYAIPARPTGFRALVDFFVRPALQPVFAAVSVLLVAVSFIFLTPQGRSVQKVIDRQIHAGYSRVEKLYAKAESVPGEINSLKTTVVDSLKNLAPEKGQEKNL
jgi:anti-sigma factor RsiW